MSIKENICKIKTQLPENVTLIAVSKTRVVEEIQEAYNEGIRDFGENKVQELIEKIDRFDSSVRWHIIGHLQTNKVKYIVGKVHLIHSVDSIKLINEIEKRYAANNLTANVLVQINIGREASKTGIFKEDLSKILEECEKCNNLKVKGLMAVIPKGPEEECRRYFTEMRYIWNDLKERNYNNISMEYLSMGMTHDYKIALEEGANVIRVGEGIFGKRNYNK